jgi:hypothetical protein
MKARNIEKTTVRILWNPRSPVYRVGIVALLLRLNQQETGRKTASTSG